MTTVSVVIPIYNIERFLHECINSILAQKYSDYEILLIDDGSMDYSGVISDEYTKNERRIITIHKKNGGVSSARNCGIENATGNQIMFVDGDDTVKPDYLQNLLIIGDEDIVQGGCKILENDYLKPKMSHKEILSDFGRYWFESGTFSVCWQSFSMRFLDSNEIRFEDDVDFAEDERFVIRCLQTANIIRRTSNCGYCYNTDIDTSATKKLRLNRLEIEQDFCERMEKVVINPSQVMPLRFLRWHYAFNHYYKFYKLEKNAYTKRQIKDAIKQAYKSVFFRECLPYIRSNGSLDQKIECYFMSYYSHKFYIPILRVVQFLSQIKRKIGGRE